MPKKSRDRRRQPRTSKQIPLSLKDADPGILNKVENISSSGVLCHTAKKLPLMGRVAMEIAIEIPVREPGMHHLHDGAWNGPQALARRIGALLDKESHRVDFTQRGPFDQHALRRDGGIVASPFDGNGPALIRLENSAGRP